MLPLQAQQGSTAQQVSPIPNTSSECPPICSKFCAPDCPFRCCNLPSLPFPYVPSVDPSQVHCQPICLRVCFNTCPRQCCSTTQSGVTRDTSSYTLTLPCPANCYHSCHDKCPMQCCKTAQHEKRRIPVLDNYSSSPLSVRSTSVCPASCHTSCSRSCPKNCCKMQIDKAGKSKRRGLSKSGKLSIKKL